MANKGGDLRAWAIAGAYVGTVVGAGFASGQEILRFFTAFGPKGLAGLAVALVLFALFGVRMLSLGRSLKAGSHRALVMFALGDRLGSVLDWILTALLAATAAAMASGAGATLAQQYDWPHWLGALLMMAASAATVLSGIRGVVRAIGMVAPVLIASVLAISIFALTSGPGLSGALAWEGTPSLAAVSPWYAASIIYVSYNLVLSVPVLAPLGAAAGSRRALLWGGLLGGVGLAVGAAAIHLAIAAGMPEAATFQIPMLYTAWGLPLWVGAAYSILLLAEVYTTAVALLFGFAARMGEEGGPRFRWAAAAGGAAAFIGGLFPFTQVVGTLYPLMGGIGLVMLVGLMRPLPSSP